MDAKSVYSLYGRPILSPLSLRVSDNLLFMLLDCSNIGNIIYLYGVMPNGNTIRVQVNNFKPYLYIKANKNLNSDDLPIILNTLNTKLSDTRAAKKIIKDQDKLSPSNKINPNEFKNSNKPKQLFAPNNNKTPIINKRENKQEEDDEDMELDELMDEVQEIEEEPDSIDLSEGETKIPNVNNKHSDIHSNGGVHSLEFITARSLMFYRGSGEDQFIKISLNDPTLMSPTVSILLHDLQAVNKNYIFKETYESNVDFYLRFMVDNGLTGCGWIELQSNQYELLEKPTEYCRTQVECRIDWLQQYQNNNGNPILKTFAKELENPVYAAIAPIRTMSFDIQCNSRPNSTLDSQHDSIIAISSTIGWIGNNNTETAQMIFIVADKTIYTDTIQKRMNADNSFQVQVVADEKELLLKWRQFFLSVDPDIIVGFEAASHDIPFILARGAMYLKQFASAQKTGKRVKTQQTNHDSGYNPFESFDYLGRDSRIQSKLHNIQVYSAAWVKSKRRMAQTSNQASAEWKISGRVFLDIQRIIQASYPLRTYSLQECCIEYLKKTEEYLDENTIRKLYSLSAFKATNIEIKDQKVKKENDLRNNNRSKDNVNNNNNYKNVNSNIMTDEMKTVVKQEANPLKNPKKLTAKDRKSLIKQEQQSNINIPMQVDNSNLITLGKKRGRVEVEVEDDSDSEFPAVIMNENTNPNENFLIFNRFLRYSLRQSELPLLLLVNLQIFVQITELARITGLNISAIFLKGQMVRTWSLLLRYCRSFGYIIPAYRDNSNQATMVSGPLLLDCLQMGTQGLYTDTPVIVCDFASLYPSIMIAYNLCYSTLLIEEDEKLYQAEDYTITPIKRKFVKKSVRHGVLPLILADLLASRGKVKKLVTETSDKFLQSILTERQKALKISANALYGFTGSNASKLLLAALAESTINYGANLLQETSIWIRQNFPIKVIYGDTDSVMVSVEPGVTVEEAIELGKEISKYASERLERPLKLEFEKVYFPFLLQQNKKYAGLKYVKNAKDYELEIKGMEPVRRDIVPLVTDLLTKTLELILINKDTQAAVELTKTTIGNVLSNKLDISQFIFTKALWRGIETSDYSAKQAHTELAERIRQRDPSRSIVLGQRLSYVFISTARDKAQHSQSEEPEYVSDNQLPLDLELYVQSYIKKPVIRLFALPGILNSVEKVEKAIFTGEHMRIVKKIVTGQTGLGLFFKAKPNQLEKCVNPNCKAMAENDLKKNPKRLPLCSDCLSQAKEIFQIKQNQHDQIQAKYNNLIQTCYNCMGNNIPNNIHRNNDNISTCTQTSNISNNNNNITSTIQSCSLSSDILCVNRDCSVYWQTKKTHQDLKVSQNLIEKFQW